MKLHAWVLALIAMAGTAGASTAQEIVSLPLGASIPNADTKMKSVDERSVSIGEIAGKKGTLVIFTCNHCPWAKAWEARIVTLGNEYASKGVGVVAVNSNDPAVAAEDSFESMQQRAKERGMKFPYVVDATSDVARVFGATRTPEVFLFDASGKLVYKGAVDDNAKDAAAVKESWLRGALEAVVAGTAPAKAETKAIGCGIKFRKKG